MKFTSVIIFSITLYTWLLLIFCSAEYRSERRPIQLLCESPIFTLYMGSIEPLSASNSFNISIRSIKASQFVPPSSRCGSPQTQMPVTTSLENLTGIKLIKSFFSFFLFQFVCAYSIISSAVISSRFCIFSRPLIWNVW